MTSVMPSSAARSIARGASLLRDGLVESLVICLKKAGPDLSSVVFSLIPKVILVNCCSMLMLARGPAIEYLRLTRLPLAHAVNLVAWDTRRITWMYIRESTTFGSNFDVPSSTCKQRKLSTFSEERNSNTLRRMNSTVESASVSRLRVSRSPQHLLRNLASNISHFAAEEMVMVTLVMVVRQTAFGR